MHLHIVRCVLPTHYIVYYIDYLHIVLRIMLPTYTLCCVLYILYYLHLILYIMLCIIMCIMLITYTLLDKESSNVGIITLPKSSSSSSASLALSKTVCIFFFLPLRCLNLLYRRRCLGNIRARSVPCNKI